MSAYADNINMAPKILTEREQMLLLKITGQRRDGFRDHVIYSVALGTGLREHEIVALNVGDVFDRNGHTRRRVQLKVFKASNPDPTYQEIFLATRLRAKLEKYLGWKKRKGQDLSQQGPLFMSRKNNRLSTRQVRHGFSVWQKRAGFDRHHSFHSLRHCSCSSHYRLTSDLRLTQRFARHRSSRSTEIYTHPTDDDLERSVEGIFC